MKHAEVSQIGALASLWLAIILSGCTSLAGTARIQPPLPPSDLAFTGLISTQADRPRPGTRYIFQTHGINSPGGDWAEQLLKAIPKYGYVPDPGPTTGYPWQNAPLGQAMVVTGHNLVCRRPEGCTFTTFGQYRKDVFINNQTHERVVVFSYRWRDDLWTITGSYVQPDIDENTFPGLSTRRSKLNALVKIHVIDDGFSDAVAYLSSLGTLEREGMETSICAMLADAINLTTPPTGAGCLGQFPAADLRPLNAVEFNFLSHSLGSRILYDVLSGTMPESRQPISVALQTRIALRLRTHELIMAANQMPLLAPSEFRVSPAVASARGTSAPNLNLPTSFVNLESTKEVVPGISGLSSNLTVVAFQDPDDLLGFKASDAIINTGKDPNVTFVDVLHRNTPQWAFLFAWPPSAHDRELEEPHSLKMILCGANVRSDGKLSARTCGYTASSP